MLQMLCFDVSTKRPIGKFPSDVQALTKEKEQVVRRAAAALA
jgi:hypothetical protein